MKPAARRPEDAALLRKELRRRGLSPAEIEQTLRKKRRRRQLDFDLVKAKRAVPPEKISPSPKPRAREPAPPALRDVCTVDVAADLLGVHPKTVLRFIRTGQLAARRVGKAWRIQRVDLEAFGGVPAPARMPDEGARITSIIDVPDVGPQQARRWSAAIASAARSGAGLRSPVSADVVHEAARRHIKIVVVGAADDAVAFMTIIRDVMKR